MTVRPLGLALLASLIILAGTAAAEEPKRDPERPDDAAWVEDCPPDMMCAAGGDNTTEPRGPSDCAYCRDHQDQDCADCLGSPMPADNTTWGTDCPPGVYCMVNGEPADRDDAGWVDCGGEVCAYDHEGADILETEVNEASAGGIAATISLALLALAGLARRGLR